MGREMRRRWKRGPAKRREVRRRVRRMGSGEVGEMPRRWRVGRRGRRCRRMKRVRRRQRAQERRTERMRARMTEGSSRERVGEGRVVGER